MEDEWRINGKEIEKFHLFLLRVFIYSRAMKTQYPNVHQYLKDVLNKLSQRISGDFMNTKYRHHIDLISFNVICPNVYMHVHISTVV